MKNKTSVLALIFVLLTISSCKKEGPGGSTTLATIVKHHSAPIPGATVYIKYGAKKFPGEDPALYDGSRIADSNGHAHFEDLRKGEYYIFATGIDTAIPGPGLVKGGFQYTITSKDKEMHVDLIIPVSEE